MYVLKIAIWGAILLVLWSRKCVLPLCINSLFYGHTPPCFSFMFYTWIGLVGWLDVMGLMALLDSISVNFKLSPRQRKKENRNDMPKKKQLLKLSTALQSSLIW